jgi:hypothetical protein
MRAIFRAPIPIFFFLSDASTMVAFLCAFLMRQFSLFLFTLFCWDCFAVCRILLVPESWIDEDDDDILVIGVLLLLVDVVVAKASSVVAVKGDIGLMSGVSGTEDGTLVTSL